MAIAMVITKWEDRPVFGAAFAYHMESTSTGMWVHQWSPVSHVGCKLMEISGTGHGYIMGMDTSNRPNRSGEKPLGPSNQSWSRDS